MSENPLLNRPRGNCAECRGSGVQSWGEPDATGRNSNRVKCKRCKGSGHEPSILVPTAELLDEGISPEDAEFELPSKDA